MKIAINGFGRIGRAIFKIAIEKKINIVAINDIHGIIDAEYLLKYDSVYGRYEKKVESKNNFLIVGGKRIKVLQERDPENLPWKSLDIDAVIESTGVFTDRENAKKHIIAGAKKVIITAPAKSPDRTIVLGVNDSTIKKSDKIFSVASCTTNCLAPLVKILEDNFGIEKAFFTTVHGYTSSQSLVDGSHKKPARGRAAALNIVPTTTGASKAVIEVIPKVKNKIDGMAIRVPVPSGSITDLTATLKKSTNSENLISLFKNYSKTKMKNIISTTSEPLVSSDIVKTPFSSIVDLNQIKCSGKMVKVLSWYDNEWGYSNRVIDLVRKLN